MKTARVIFSVLLGLLIFTITIMEINPVDTSLADRIKELEIRLDATQRTRQPYLGDWYEFNTSLFTYVSDNIVDVDDSIVLRDVFQIGDKVRVTQDGGYKYFYIIKLTTATNQITLNGGSDYTFDNSTFSTFGISKLVSPTGFPTAFNFTPTYTFSGGGSPTINPLSQVSYTLTGSVLQVNYYVLFTITSPTTGLNATLPFEQGGGGTIRQFLLEVSSSTGEDCLHLGGTNFIQSAFSSTSGAVWTTNPVMTYFPPN